MRILCLSLARRWWHAEWETGQVHCSGNHPNGYQVFRLRWFGGLTGLWHLQLEGHYHQQVGDSRSECSYLGSYGDIMSDVQHYRFIIKQKAEKFCS